MKDCDYDGRRYERRDDVWDGLDMDSDHTRPGPRCRGTGQVPAQVGQERDRRPYVSEEQKPVAVVTGSSGYLGAAVTRRLS